MKDAAEPKRPHQVFLKGVPRVVQGRMHANLSNEWEDRDGFDRRSVTAAKRQRSAEGEARPIQLAQLCGFETVQLVQLRSSARAHHDWRPRESECPHTHRDCSGISERDWFTCGGPGRSCNVD